jgi:hypothetical protein
MHAAHANTASCLQLQCTTGNNGTCDDSAGRLSGGDNDTHRLSHVALINTDVLVFQIRLSVLQRLCRLVHLQLSVERDVSCVGQ